MVSHSSRPHGGFSLLPRLSSFRPPITDDPTSDERFAFVLSYLLDGIAMRTHHLA